MNTLSIAPAPPQAPEPLPRAVVVRAAVILELFLLLLAIVWALIRDFSFSIAVTEESAALGSAVVLGLLMLNFTLLKATQRPSGESAALPGVGFGSHRWQTELDHFKNHIVWPIVGNLTTSSAAILALLSGIAEEMFFRGVLWAEIHLWCGTAVALAVSSAVFALAHFGSHIREYPRVGILYVFYGLVLGVLYVQTDSLLIAMAAHAAYNFLAFAILTRGFTSANDADHFMPSTHQGER